MPVRVVLNVAYSLWTQHMTSEQRQEFDTLRYGFGEMNERANRALFTPAGDDVRPQADSGGDG